MENNSIEGILKGCIGRIYNLISIYCIILLNFFKNKTVRRMILFAAFCIFSIGIFISLRSFPGEVGDIEYQFAVFNLVILTPISIFLLAVDFVLQCRFAGARIGFYRALEVTIVGSAANILPLPAGAAIRVAAVKGHGGKLSSGLYSILLFSVLMLCVGLLYSGFWMLSINTTVAISLIAVGLLLFAPSVLYMKLSSQEKSIKFLSSVIFIKIFQIVISVSRIHLSFLALGFPVSYAQAASFVVSGALGTIIWIVPGGIGVRELFSAAMAPVVGIDPSAAFLAVAISWLIFLAAIAPLALIFAYSSKR